MAIMPGAHPREADTALIPEKTLEAIETAPAAGKPRSASSCASLPSP